MEGEMELNFWCIFPWGFSDNGNSSDGDGDSDSDSSNDSSSSSSSTDGSSDGEDKSEDGEDEDEGEDYDEEEDDEEDMYKNKKKKNNGNSGPGEESQLFGDIMQDDFEFPGIPKKLPEGIKLRQLGAVHCLVGQKFFVVKTFFPHDPLGVGTIVTLRDGSCVGRIQEVFGPVQGPFYGIRKLKPQPMILVPASQGDTTTTTTTTTAAETEMASSSTLQDALAVETNESKGDNDQGSSVSPTNNNDKVDKDNTAEEAEEGEEEEESGPPEIIINTAIYYAPFDTNLVFHAVVSHEKGTDASRKNDEEAGESDIEFSDDEKEREYYKMKNANKRRRGNGNVNSAASAATSAENATSAPPVAKGGNKKHGRGGSRDGNNNGRGGRFNNKNRGANRDVSNLNPYTPTALAYPPIPFYPATTPTQAANSYQHNTLPVVSANVYMNPYSSPYIYQQQRPQQQRPLYQQQPYAAVSYPQQPSPVNFFTMPPPLNPNNRPGNNGSGRGQGVGF